MLDAVDVGTGLVDFVDSHHDFDAGLTGEADSLNRLRLNAVIGRHHDDGQVGRPGAVLTQGGKGFVARRIQESYLALLMLNLIGRNVLGDAASLALGDISAADGV